MRRLFYVSTLLVISLTQIRAQVRPEYLYNTTLPYGTLDIRTRISASDYYYLVEGKTFSFRESAPGVRTDTYHKMTNYDTSPFQEGHMRHAKGGDDTFEMNYRFLLPRGHQPEYQPGYPMIVLMHGAIERANCYYDECYHGDWDYDPNTNFPPAPTSSDHPLLNNDHHLSIGARDHLNARNRAGNRLPDDPTMPDRSFPGFVLMPQMFNDWDSLWVEKVIRIVQLHIEKYNIDPNRIYIHGLSIGGYATYEAIKRAPWLFTAALPISAVSEAANIFKHNQQDKVSHIPLWIFQGERDTEPTVAWTKGVMQKFKDAGGNVRYTEYPGIGHNIWGWAYNEPEFFSFMLSRNKSDIHAKFQRTEINAKENLFPELVLAEGFFAYQWEKDGKIISGARSNKYVATEPGVYRARFSRVASPSSGDWNRWSNPITITATAVEEEDEEPDEEEPQEEEPDEEEPEEEEPDEEQPGEQEPDPDDDSPGEEEQPGDDEQSGEETPDDEDPGDNHPGDDDTGDDTGDDDEDGNPDNGNGDDDSQDSGSDEGSGDGDNNDDPDEQHGTPGGDDDVITSLPDEIALEIFVYPNPVDSHTIMLDVRNPSGQSLDYTITDALGRVQLHGNIAGAGVSGRVAIESEQALGDGVYILHVKHPSGDVKKRIVIRRR